MPQSITQHTKINLNTPAKDNRSEALNSKIGAPEPLRNRLGTQSGSSGVLATAAEFLTIKQIALEMQLGLTSVARLVKLGRLRAINISTGRRPTYRISRESYESFKVAGIVDAPVIPPIRPRRQIMPPGIEEFV